MSLDPEHPPSTPISALKLPNFISKISSDDFGVAKQLAFLEKTKIFSQWPSYTSI